VRTDRRGFFRILGSTLAVLSGRSIRARAQEGALEIHQSTRNTLLGALGRRFPIFQTAPSPFKPYSGAKRLKLPAVVGEPALPLTEAVRRYARAKAFEPTTLSLAQLSRLLYYTNGVTGQAAGKKRTVYLRAAPSAGALYSGEVYVVAEGVRGLSSGVYYYGVKEHELVPLQSGSFLDEIGRALAQPRAIENAGAVILLSNVFHRYTWRYANRGYRYALIDTGHIAENLRLAAVSVGLGETGSLRFHDDLLNRLLQVDGREEAVCAIHALGRPADSAKASDGVRRFVEKQRASPQAVPGKAPVIERYHEATKLVPSDAEKSRPISAEKRAPAAGSGVELTKRSAPPMTSVEESIRERRSAERFVPEPLALEDLSFVVEMAQGHAALERAAGVDLYLAVHRVKDLDPGLYRYEPRLHRLALRRPGDLSGPMTRACLGQKKAGSAAVGFLMVGRLGEAASRTGDRSYRDLLVESGGIGQRLYLAAEAAGLVARNLAAFVDDELNQLMGLDGRREAVIHLTMVGHGS
jgi:SagB-type dehydrogenase family enzyme